MSSKNRRSAVVATRVRKALRLSQTEIAHILQVSPPMISRYEHGSSEPPGMISDMYHALDRALSRGVDADAILDHIADERGRFLLALFTLAYAPDDGNGNRRKLLPR